MSCLECYICKTKDPPLFEFPYGSMLFDWLNNINVKITAYNLDMRLCSIHFEKHYISTSKAKLSKKAVPTLCLGPGVSTKSNSQKRVWNRGCCIPECKTDRKSGIRLFSFPRDERRRDWIFTTGIKCNVRKCLYACILHFDEKFIKDSKLVDDAMPIVGIHPSQQHVLDNLYRPSRRDFLSSDDDSSFELSDEEDVKIEEPPKEEEPLEPGPKKYGCAVPGCRTSNLTNVRFFGFPKDDRRQTWLDSVGLSNCKRKCLMACVLHFDRKMVRNTRIERHAVPVPGVHPSQAWRLEDIPEEEVEDECELEPHEIDMIVKPKKPITDVRTINKTCSVPGCDTNNLTNLRLFGFPKDERFEVWKESVGRSQSKRKKLYACVLHFDSKHVNNTRLDKDAIPILGVHPSQVHWLEPLKKDESEAADTANTDSIQSESHSSFEQNIEPMDTVFEDIEEESLAGFSSVHEKSSSDMEDMDISENVPESICKTEVDLGIFKHDPVSDIRPIICKTEDIQKEAAAFGHGSFEAVEGSSGIFNHASDSDIRPIICKIEDIQKEASAFGHGIFETVEGSPGTILLKPRVIKINTIDIIKKENPETDCKTEPEIIETPQSSISPNNVKPRAIKIKLEDIKLENLTGFTQETICKSEVDLGVFQNAESGSNVQESKTCKVEVNVKEEVKTEPQAIINQLGINGGFLPGTRTIVRIIEKKEENCAQRHD